MEEWMSTTAGKLLSGLKKVEADMVVYITIIVEGKQVMK